MHAYCTGRLLVSCVCCSEAVMRNIGIRSGLPTWHQRHFSSRDYYRGVSQGLRFELIAVVKEWNTAKQLSSGII